MLKLLFIKDIVAATDDEFIRLVGEVLQSKTVRALIYSLIARINAHKIEQPTNGPDQVDDKETGGSDREETL